MIRLNTSSASDYCPSPFKTAFMALVHKPSKDLTDTKSYQPISLGKVGNQFATKAVFWRSWHDHDNLAFAPIIRRKTHWTYWCVNNKSRDLKTDLVIKYREWAFDTDCYAVGLQALLYSFLDNHRLKLKFKAKVSVAINMHVGVPQGSIIELESE